MEKIKHSPMCKINRVCLVYHTDGICPDAGKCDCGGNYSGIKYEHSLQPKIEKSKCCNEIIRVASEPEKMLGVPSFFCSKCGETCLTPQAEEVEDWEKNLLEKLAELEHIQWEEWSKNIAGNEPISEDRYQRWCKLWKPYSKLTENEKDQDRVYARKVMKIISSNTERVKKDLIEKIRFLKVDEKYIDKIDEERCFGYNQALDDIISLIK